MAWEWELQDRFVLNKQSKGGLDYMPAWAFAEVKIYFFKNDLYSNVLDELIIIIETTLKLQVGCLQKTSQVEMPSVTFTIMCPYLVIVKVHNIICEWL